MPKGKKKQEEVSMEGVQVQVLKTWVVHLPDKVMQTLRRSVQNTYFGKRLEEQVEEAEGAEVTYIPPSGKTRSLPDISKSEKCDYCHQYFSRITANHLKACPDKPGSTHYFEAHPRAKAIAEGRRRQLTAGKRLALPAPKEHGGGE